MEVIDKLLTAILFSPVLIALANWVLSLIYTRSKQNYFLDDLKQLWPDSLPFLKAQWPILTSTLAIATWIQLQQLPELSAKTEFGLPILLLFFGSSGITWILNLFYITYLAAPKYPGRVATIGAWALALYIVADISILTFGAIGIIFLVIPGLIVFVRSCLFLPIYAIQGYKPLSAIRQSWTLTKGKYWLVSRYMGLPVLLMLAIAVFPELLNSSLELDSAAPSSNFEALNISFTAANQVLGLVIAGLLYKLYERLSEEQEQQLTT